LMGQGTAVTLAVMGAGLWSLVAGSLMTVLTGSLLVNLFAPWRPRLALPVGVGQSLLRFGLPYQGQGLVHLAKDQAVPALGGLFFASAQLGYLTWSQDVARWPRLPADYAARVAFPAFARLQQNAVALNQLLGSALRLIGWLSFGAAAVGIGLASRLVGPVFGSVWQPAIPALIIFLAQTPLDALAAILLPLIYATGQVGKGLRLSLIWTALTWLFSLVALLAGADWWGLAAAFGLATAVTLPLIIRQLPDGIQVPWKTAVLWPAGVSLLLAVGLRMGIGG
jgi:teichuronic acid exporter